MRDDPRESIAGIEVEVSNALSGERVDRAAAIITGRTRSEITAMIQAGQISVNGRVVATRHRRVELGDRIHLAEDASLKSPTPVPAEEGTVLFEVLYEDEAIIVVDKPAGLVVHPGAGHRDDTLVSGLIARYPDLVQTAREGNGDLLRPGIVHRLDKDTSGLLIVARTPAAYASLSSQLMTRTMGREYLALAAGRFENDHGTIEAPIGRSSRSPTKMAVHAGGREARTGYRVLTRYDRPIALTLVQLKLETGRTHQIRVHLKAIGHPVVGDLRYGGGRAEVALDRPFLHAERLRIVHPTTELAMEWRSPLPAPLLSCLRELHELDSGGGP